MSAPNFMPIQSIFLNDFFKNWCQRKSRETSRGTEQTFTDSRASILIHIRLRKYQEEDSVWRKVVFLRSVLEMDFLKVAAPGESCISSNSETGSN